MPIKPTQRIFNFLSTLYRHALRSINFNYSVSAHDVSHAQLREAQHALDEAIISIAPRAINTRTNDLLKLLLKIIPRSKTGSEYHTLPGLRINYPEAQKLLWAEQGLLDAMRGMVTAKVVARYDDYAAAASMYKALGVKFYGLTSEDKRQVNKLLGFEFMRFHNGYRVYRADHSVAFEQNLSQATNKETKLLLYGARNENWWDLLCNGLQVRSGNTCLPGQGLGDGIRLEALPKAAINRSSLVPNYWERGMGGHGFVGIYEVHTGSNLNVSEQSNNKKDKFAYDSLTVTSTIPYNTHTTAVYDPAQTRIWGLIELI